MNQIFLERPSPEFAQCWAAAASHLDFQLKRSDRGWPSGPFQLWYKRDLRPPFLEHLSFRIGNQLFFIRVEDSDGKVTTPGTVEGLYKVAAAQGGHACVMPMRLTAGKWMPTTKEWGLLEAASLTPINPISFVSFKPVEMTDWEVHDLAVDVVSISLKKEGWKVVIHQNYADLDPAIWFVHPMWGPAWVIVRATRYPADPSNLSLPPIWKDMLMFGIEKGIQLEPQKARERGTRGYFARVGIVSGNESFSGSPEPLLRGWPMRPIFSGIPKSESSLGVWTGVRDLPQRPLGWFLTNS